MRITRVSLYHKHLPMLCSSFTCSLEPGVTSADVVIVRVETDAGLTGYGEAGAVGGYPNYASGIMASSAELIQRHLIHKDPRDINAIGHLMSLIDGHGSIKSAFDIACWDLLGQSLGQPLSVLLGGKLRDAVPVYRGLPLKAPEEMGKEAEAWRTEGYRMFLMKVGCGDLAEDVACIEAVMAKRRPGEHYTVDACAKAEPRHQRKRHEPLGPPTRMVRSVRAHRTRRDTIQGRAEQDLTHDKPSDFPARRRRSSSETGWTAHPRRAGADAARAFANTPARSAGRGARPSCQSAATGNDRGGDPGRDRQLPSRASHCGWFLTPTQCCGNGRDRAASQTRIDDLARSGR
jgi:hypothetical protein